MLQVFLTLLPLMTVMVTGLVAAVTAGPARWGALLGIPLLGTILSWAALPISGENGNMLAVVLLLVLTVGLALYYPIVVVMLLSRRRRKS